MISPMVRRRRLASELRDARDMAGLTVRQLAKQLGWSASKVSRMETDFSAPNAGHVSDVLDALGIGGSRWHALMQMAHEGGERGWWVDLGEHLGSRQQVNADLEWGAVTIAEYTGSFVPGLLQIRDYTRARHESAKVRQAFPSSTSLDDVLDARLMRQRMIRRPQGPEYTAIVDELALRRPAAARNVMHDQIRELVRLQTEEPRTTIKVLPIDAEIEGYWLPSSIFSRYTYEDPGDPTMVVVEGESSHEILELPKDLAPYETLLACLADAALSPSRSTDLMLDIVRTI